MRQALAVALALGSTVLLATLAHAAQSPKADPPNVSAPQNISVDDLQRILAKDNDAPDAAVARQLSGLVLTEKISDAALESLEQDLPGAESRAALVALADASVFLPSPAAVVPPQAPPSLDEQRRMIALTVDYLGKTLPKLPDFYAARTTVRYDGDAPVVSLRRRAMPQGDSSWHRVGSSRVVVTYRDGKEVIDLRGWGKDSPEGTGLITRGTFGPILSTVIVDAAHGDMRWDRWERDAPAKLAVFRYSVPDNQSHYSVAFNSRPGGKAGAEDGVGYHGEVAIDPDTGTILRLTVQADPAILSPILRADVMIEYGPVVLGGKTYICPRRSVSISLTTAGLAGQFDPYGRVSPAEEAILLNDVTFDDYHLFRSESRILTGNTPTPQR